MEREHIAKPDINPLSQTTSPEMRAWTQRQKSNPSWLHWQPHSERQPWSTATMPLPLHLSKAKNAKRPPDWPSLVLMEFAVMGRFARQANARRTSALPTNAHVNQPSRVHPLFRKRLRNPTELQRSSANCYRNDPSFQPRSPFILEPRLFRHPRMWNHQSMSTANKDKPVVILTLLDRSIAIWECPENLFSRNATSIC